MKATDFIRAGLERSAAMTLALIEDMKDRPLTFPTPNGGNHPLWIVAHLAYAEGQFHQFMLGRENPLAHWKELVGPGTEPAAEAARYPTFDQAKKAFQDLRAETIRTLDTLTDADLDRPCKACPPELAELIGTLGKCFLVLIMHPMHHRGQAADARRTAGRKPLRM